MIARVVDAPHIDANRRLPAVDVYSRLGGGSPRMSLTPVPHIYANACDDVSQRVIYVSNYWHALASSWIDNNHCMYFIIQS